MQGAINLLSSLQPQSEEWNTFDRMWEATSGSRERKHSWEGGNFRFAGTQAFLNSGEKNPYKVQVWGSQAVRCYTRVFKLLCTTCPWLNCGTNWVERVGMARLSMTPWAIMRETGVARDVNNPGQRATKTNQNWLGAVPAKDGFAGTAQNWKSRIFLCWGAMTYFGLVEIAPPKWPCC